ATSSSRSRQQRWMRSLARFSKNSPTAERELSIDSADLSAAGSAAGQSAIASEEMLTRVGHMTRTLHESLRGLGFDQLVERASYDIPDARDRLDYVARMTEQAAQRVLGATELASPLQQEIQDHASRLS